MKAVSDKAGGDNPALAEGIAKEHQGIGIIRSKASGCSHTISFLFVYTACRVLIYI